MKPMGDLSLVLSISILAMTASVACTGDITGARMEIDWRGLVSQADIEMTTPPADSYQGLLMGNGDLASSLFGPPAVLTLHVGKNDIWDYRDPMDDKRPRTHKEFLEKYADTQKPPVTNYIWDENADALNVAIRRTYGKPMPSIKPAGKIRFRNGSLTGQEYLANLNLWDAEVTAGCNRSGRLLRAFVSYPRNLIVVDYDPFGAAEFDIELVRHRDAAGAIPNHPEFGATNNDLWVRYRFPPDPATYPDGFEYSMYARVLGADRISVEVVEEFARIQQAVWRAGQVATDPIETVEGAAVAHVHSRDRVTLFVAVCTTRDDPDPFERARREIDLAVKEGVQRLVDEHRAWWHAYWQKSCVYFPERPVLNRVWSFSQYLLACSWRPGKIAPGLFGSWTWEDFPLFGNDYHWDYNMQQAVWGAYSSNHLEQAYAYNETVTALLPTAVTDARETYGIDGAKFFLTSYPRKYAHNPFPLLHYDKMMSLNGWVAHPMWWGYLYSQDLDYLREQAYPVIRACAEFYRGYLSRADDGKYDIWPTAAWDVDFTPHLEFNKNFPMDLSFIRYLMKACISASDLLEVDEEARERWQDIADNLREYPTMDTPEGKIFTAYPGSSSDYHFPLAAAMVFPGDDIGLHSPRDILATALRTVAPMTYSGDEQLLKAMLKARLGVDDMDAFEKQLQATTRPNGKTSYGGQWFFWVHGAGNSIWINESLLQSYDGRIRVAPVKIKTGAFFQNLRAVGAFLVSGEIRPGGGVACLSIASEAGAPCTLLKPWNGPIRVRNLESMKAVKTKQVDDAIVFQTETNATYIVDRPFDPWEDQPLSKAPKAVREDKTKR